MKNKAFSKWLLMAKRPQGNYELWQEIEFDRFALREWKAGLKSASTTRADTRPDRGMEEK